MKNLTIETDHIDPRWREGRDYQLVCGLDVPGNFREATREENTSKNNRFLPYRVSQDSIGCVPCSPGDLCLFWDPDTKDWVLEEFLGDWWYKKTNRYAGGCRALEAWRKDNKGKSGRAQQKERKDPGYEVRKQWETFRSDPELLAKRNAKIGESIRKRDLERPEIRKKAAEGIKKSKQIKYQCLVTGYIGNSSAVSQYQIRNGIDHKNPHNRKKLN